jgi:hypothetical protein
MTQGQDIICVLPFLFQESTRNTLSGVIELKNSHSAIAGRLFFILGK